MKYAVCHAYFLGKIGLDNLRRRVIFRRDSATHYNSREVHMTETHHLKPELLLLFAVGVALAILTATYLYANESEPVGTDTEVGCVDDCLEPVETWYI